MKSIRTRLPLVLWTLLISAGAAPVAAQQEPGMGATEGSPPLWLVTYRDALAASDRGLGDFEAVYSFTLRRRMNTSEEAAPVPPGEWTTPYITSEGTLTVRRRGGDVTSIYDYKYTRTKLGVGGDGARMSEQFFFEDGEYVARLDGDMLTYQPGSFMIFSALPPFDVDLGYSHSPRGLIGPADHAARWLAKSARVTVDPTDATVENYVRADPAFSRKWGVGHNGARIDTDGQDGRIDSLTPGVFLSLSDGSTRLFPFFKVEVTERREGFASRVRWRAFDSSRLNALDTADSLAQACAALDSVEDEPETDVDLTLLRIGPLPADSGVSIADFESRVARLRQGEEGTGWEWVNRLDPATGKRVRERQFDRGTGEWVVVAASQ